MTDDELKKQIVAVKNGDETAFVSLLEQFRPLVGSLTKKYANLSGLPEDGTLRQELMQDARLALYSAALSFNPDQTDVSFGLYAKICVRNALVSSLRRISGAERKRRRAENDARVRSGRAGEPETFEAALLPRREELLALLSSYERDVFQMMLDGKPVRVIAAETGKSAKSVSNALFRVRAKIKRMLNHS